MILYVFIALLGISLGLNVFLFMSTKKPKKSIQQTYDVQALLRDLASGPALLKVEYLDRADVLLRSPRHFSK